MYFDLIIIGSGYVAAAQLKTAIVEKENVCLNWGCIPMCIYSNTEISSVGFSEKEAINKGYKLKIGITALGKAKLNDSTDGFIIDDNSGELLGCHMIGSGVTELISEIVVARKLETTSFELHPTISESVVEAITNAYNKCIHI
ncbi:hypothetical protein [Candidatus Karelsulcia muelleri]|uniref:hypothetical protein n=1 Tax=Candidatus Karelsulcia muelleri TaxID=336810 RepID=UPI0035C8E315